MTSIYQGEHSPTEHFARLGYAHIVQQLDLPPNSRLDEDAEDYPARRKWLTDRAVCRAIRGAEPKTIKAATESPDDAAGAAEIPASIAGVRITWHLAMPELKVWAGRATMTTLVARRQAALWTEEWPTEQDLLAWQVPLRTISGLDPRSAPTALEIGFSLDQHDMWISTHAAAELLQIVGMEVAPITRHGRRSYGYDSAGGERWMFGTEARAGYHRRYTMSRSA